MNVAVKQKTQPTPAKPVRTERPHQGLTKTQEQLAELATDILLNGGARPEVDSFLEGLASHYRRRYLSGLHRETPPKTEEVFADAALVDGWYRELAKHWREEAKTCDLMERPRDLTAAGRIARLDIRAKLQDRFQEVLYSMHDVESPYLLNEILEYYTNDDYDIAAAFARVIEEDTNYVRVPSELKEKVEEFVTLLQKRAA